ncbi:hypothetical protein B0T21DRAFT_382874 [Apiosordaria backusii]|uniref:Uncharacterized protein n=1 Tax=Apiosordaria backusii TaxID=314023 RepID=A0AA40BT82_9PEZI|nr:hypothetical protein B0T21DRAFT_382874 [Apiosordaria backusii]
MDELPMDDGELADRRNTDKGSKGGKGGKKHGHNHHTDHQPEVEYRRRRQNPNAALVERGAKMSNVWNDAIASGAFDDDDAAEVKGLDDLGGARLHAKSKTLTLLNYQRNNLPPFAMQPPAKKQRTSHEQIDRAFKNKEPLGGHHNRNQNASSSKMAAPSRHSSSSATLGNAAIPVSQYGGNQQIANPPNMAARAEVLLTPPGKNASMPSIVFLTVAGAPILGYCMMFVENKLFAQFTISEYQDFMSSDLTLSLHFGENVLFFSLTFRNTSELEGFLKVLREIKAGKYAVVAVESSAQRPAPDTSIGPKKSAPTKVAPAKTAPAKTAPAKTAPEKAAPAESTFEKPVVHLPPPTAQAAVPTPKTVQYASRILTGEASSNRQPGEQQRAHSAQGVLINLDANDTSHVSDRRSSEASALLSTLQPYGKGDSKAITLTQNGASEEQSAPAPYDHNNSRANTPAQNGALTLEPFKLSVPEAIAMCRNILATFILKKAGGKTKRELAATVDGIREAVMEVVCGDFTESERQDIIAQIEVYLNSSAATSGQHHRLKYTKEEMYGMIKNQVQPPPWLSNLTFLPPRTETRQPPRLENPLYTHPVDDVVTKQHIRKSTMGMDWVLGKTKSSVSAASEQPLAVGKAESSKPAPVKPPVAEKAKENTSVQTSTTTSQPSQDPARSKPEPRKPDVGLQASRWSSVTAAPIQHSNAFTGLPYENRWKKGSYLYDLAQLDPQAKVEAPIEDVVEFFLPTSQAGGQAAALSSFQMLNGNPTLQSSASDLSSDTQVRDLGRQMAQLTLKSPSGSRATSCSSVQRESIDQVSQLIPIEEDLTASPFNAAARTFTPTVRAFAPPTSTPPPANPNTPSSTSTLRGLGASRHASRAALPTAGQFNFHLPKSPLK